MDDVVRRRQCDVEWGGARYLVVRIAVRDHGDGGNTAEHVDQHGICDGSASDGAGCIEQSDRWSDGDVHGTGLGSERQLQRFIDGDGDDQQQRGGDGSDSDGQWDDRQLHGDGVGEWCGDAGQFQSHQYGGNRSDGQCNGGNTAEHDDQYGVCDGPAGEGTGCVEQSGQWGDGDVHGAGLGSERELQRFIDGDSDEQQ